MEELIIRAINESLSNIHTIVIAKITKVNSNTINCKPCINRIVGEESIELPEFAEVPVITLQGGNSYIHLPIADDDYCLLLVSERNFDKWYHGKDFDIPDELNKFDYSDCFALVGINPLGRAIPIPEVTTFIGDIHHEGDYNMVGNLTVNGNIKCTGTIAAANFTGLNGNPLTSTTDIISSGKSLQHHTHSGVQTGIGSTGQPN